MEKQGAFRKYPVLLVAVSLVGIGVLVLVLIASLGKAKFFTYFGLFMNLVFYVNILIFALYGYHNEKSLTKKPVKNMLQSFCTLMLIVTLTTRPFLLVVALINGVVILLDLLIMSNVKNIRRNRLIVLAILALLIVAAVFKFKVYGAIPQDVIPLGVWCFNVVNQVIQWTAFGLSYILRFTEYERAGYLE